MMESTFLMPVLRRFCYIYYQRVLIHSPHSSSFHRMFTAFPGSKTYFSHLDISPRSPHMLSHGRKIVLAIAEGAQDISQLAVSLAPLQILHAYQLRIDPTNFKVPPTSPLISKFKEKSHNGAYQISHFHDWSGIFCLLKPNTHPFIM